MIRIITFLIVFLTKVDFPIFQINVSKTSSYKFSYKRYCYYCQEAIMKKSVQLNCIVTDSEGLDDGQIFFGIACCQEKGSIVCKNRQTEEAKSKVHIFVYKI